MALHLLILENEERRCLMAERLLEDPEDVLHFDDKTLISNYRLPRNMILQLAQELQPALQRPTKRHGALPVILQVTNALRFFAKADFQSEVASIAKMSQPGLSKNLTEVAKAISALAPTYIRFPTGGELSTTNKIHFNL